jgi:2-succinyl-6-hydroxy-2,4-cyclohexadiene-1-carboxylate synthase
MVLFIPGFMQRGDAWRPVAELLPERYPSVMLEHEQNSFEGRLGEIAAAGEGRLLVGYSLGGRLVLRAALRDPERYLGVVTIGATAGIDEPTLRGTRAEADDRLAAWMEAAPIEDIVGVWERQPLFADQSEALIEAQRPGRLTQDPGGLAMILRTAGQGVLEPVWHELLTLELPVLAIAGARDEGYTSAAQKIAATAPNAKARIVADAGHAAHLQQPDELAALIADFRAELDG